MSTSKAVVSISYGSIFSKHREHFDTVQSAIDFLKTANLKKVRVAMSVYSGGTVVTRTNMKGQRASIISILERTKDNFNVD